MSDGLMVLSVMVAFVLVIAAVIAWAMALERKRKKQWSDFAELHRLRPGEAAGQPWSEHFGFRLGRASTFSDVYMGEVQGVAVALFNTSTGSSGEQTNHGTFLALQLEGSEVPPCMFLPGALGPTFKKLLGVLGAAVGVRAFDVPTRPELARDYTVLGPEGADLDAALGAIDVADFVARPPRLTLIGSGWLIVGPLPGRVVPVHVLQTLEELQQQLEQALELRGVVAAW